jgi:GNAT superfamily N-acetyltransferase
MTHTISNSKIKITENKDEIVIDLVFVQKEERGQGIGRQLVEWAISYGRSVNKNIGLYAEPQTDDGLDGDALIEFYRSCGFVSDGDCNELMTYTV